MKRVLLVAAMLCVAVGAVRAQAPANKVRPGAGGPSTDLANDAAIRKLYEGFIAAWNRHDAKTMASFWALDGDTTEPDGMVAKGRDEVEKHFATEQSTAMKDSQLKLTVDSVWFLDTGVAMVDGTYIVLNARDPNGQALPPRKGLVSAVLIKEAGTWHVAASRSMIPIPLPWRPR